MFCMIEFMEHKIKFCDAFNPFIRLELKPIDWFSLFHKIINGLINSKLIQLSVIFIFIVQVISCKPLNNYDSIGRTKKLSDNFTFAMDFLVRFGYLPKTDRNSGSLLSDKQLKNAIKEMQSFAHLSPTGIIDQNTINQMKRKRCGVPDFAIPLRRRLKRYAIQGSKWDKTDLTWSVKDWKNGFDSEYVLNQLRKAFKIWSDVSKLKFTETRRADADIIISFLRGNHGDEYPFDGPGSILGHAFFPGDQIGGDAHFDADEHWNQRKYNLMEGEDQNWEGVSLFSVAAHEFGHSLGLSHSSVSGSLMFPYYQTIGDDFKLPYDDMIGIQQLYGAKTPNRWSPIPSVPTSPNDVNSVTIRPKTGSPTHRRRTSPKFSSEYPNPCHLSSIDAIASIRGNIFIFKSKYFWWLKDNRQIERVEPIEITHYWSDLPKNLTHVDAVYERQTDKKIVFFIGKQLWLFDNTNSKERDYPKPLTSIGLSKSVERVDAAMIWGHNAKTYLFSGSDYWRFEEQENYVELDYPRDISVWSGVPKPIDAAFQWSVDSQTYFFKDLYFWKFDNKKMEISDGFPKRISQFWFESYLCRIDDKNNSSDGIPKDTQKSIINLSPNQLTETQNYLLTICLIFYNFYIFNVLYH